MSTFVFTENELDMLSIVAGRLEFNSEVAMDSDTLHVIQKIDAGNPEIELSEIERISLATLVNIAISIAESNPDGAQFDTTFLKAIAQKLSH